MGGGGAEIQGPLWKSSGRCCCQCQNSRARPLQKLQWKGNRALIKTSLRVLDTQPQVLNNRDDVFRNPEEASLLLGNIFEQPHPDNADLAKNRVEGTITGQLSTAYNTQSDHSPYSLTPASKIHMCLLLNHLDLVSGPSLIWGGCCSEQSDIAHVMNIGMCGTGITAQ